MRLQSFLAQSGVASRRNVIGELDAGKVKVNGEVVRIPSYPIYPDRDEVTYEDKPVKLSRNKLYFVFNKPGGVISTAKDTHGRKTVLDFFKDVKDARLYPVGRLDQDTTGLLLLTNDGDLAHRLMHPRYGVQKVYEALLGGEISKEQIERLEKGGVEIEGRPTSECKIKVLSVRDGKTCVEIYLREGRKRQIRVIFESIGIRVIHLHRKRYGPLNLKGLAPGKYRALTEAEVKLLQSGIVRTPSLSLPRRAGEGRGGGKGQEVTRERKESVRIENRNEPIDAARAREHRGHGLRRRHPFHRG